MQDCTVVCPIDYGYAQNPTCDDQAEAGLGSQWYIAAYCSVDSLVESACPDRAITDIEVLKNTTGGANDHFFGFKVKSNSGLGETEGTLNDNNILSEVDTITGQGSFTDKEHFCFFRQFKNKEVMLIAERKDGKYLIYGWDGGLRLSQYQYTTGQDPTADFHGFNFTFTNDEGDGVLLLEPDAVAYPNGVEDLLAVIT